MTQPLIIAEFGSSPAAYGWPFAEWCEAARQAGANAVKVQIFYSSHFPPPYDAHHKPHEFPRERLGEFVRAAHVYDLSVGASVFDEEAAILTGQECDWMKLASREEQNWKLLTQVYDNRKPGTKIYRSLSNFSYFASDSMIIHLYALQEYPAPMWKSFYWLIQAVRFFKRKRVAWGWSSHTTGFSDCVMAAQLGASVIEKHLMLSPQDIEASHSLLPRDFARMVKAIRQQGV